MIKILTSHFAEHGTPEQLFSDNGPPFHSKRFKEFCDQKGIQHISSSPRYPRSNGLAERAVQTAKKIISRCQASRTPVDVALMEHRNTPFSENMPSPSELALGRKLRTPFPHKKSELTLRGYPREEIEKKYDAYKKKQKDYFDRGTRPLAALKCGSSVWIKEDNKWAKGKVIEVLGNFPRSYVLRKQNGLTIRRNQQDLRPRMNEDYGGADSQSELFPEDEQRRDQNSRFQHVPNVEESSNCCSRYGRKIMAPRRYGFS